MARFLKVEVLPVLAQSFEIKMVRQSRSTPVNDIKNVRKGKDGFEFVWKVVDPNEVPLRKGKGKITEKKLDSER
jgi:hypothetical protein